MKQLTFCAFLTLLTTTHLFGSAPISKFKDSDSIYLPDSVIIYTYPEGKAVKSEKHINVFNENGAQTLEAYYKWDSVLNKWVGNNAKGFAKKEIHFDENGNQILEVYFSWSTEQNDWIGYNTTKGYGKRESSFDSVDNKLTEINYVWNTAQNGWIKNFKTEWKYNDAGEIIQSANYEWDLGTGNWIGYSDWMSENGKNEYGYDTNGNLTLFIHYRWSVSKNAWVEETKKEYSYDETGTLLLETYSEWDLISKSFIPINKSDYSYDEKLNLLLHTVYSWNTRLNNWSLISNNKSDYSYDNSGNLTLKVNHNWDLNLNDWRYTNKTECSYDSAGNLTSDVSYTYVSERNQWTEIEKTENEYNESGQLVYKRKYSWQSKINEWLLVTSNKYEYYQTEDQTTRINYIWNTELKDWVCTTLPTNVKCKYKYGNIERSVLIENIYDEYGILDLELRYEQTSDYWVLKSIHRGNFNENNARTIDTEYSWNFGLNRWSLNSKTFYYYSNASAGSQELLKNITIYPNPTSGIINFMGIYYPVDVNIYGLNGQLIESFQQIINSIDITEFPAGIYMLGIKYFDQKMLHKVLRI